MSIFSEKLISVANKNDATKNLINEENAIKLELLANHMLEVNKTLNLTAIKDEDGVILKHLVDSSAVAPFIPENATLCDIGCGGGFPSLVIAILRPDVSVFSVDSVSKKVAYVENTAQKFGLTNEKTSNERAEVLGQGNKRESFDVVTARAVGRLNLISELCIPLVKVGGVFLAMKSLSTDEELEEAKKAIDILGGKVEKVFTYTLTDGNETIERSIVVIRKIKNTPSKYPRNNSQIAKKPL